MDKILLISFGGPRSFEEVEPFLKELLTDQEMVRTSLPVWLHCALFSFIAKLRAPVFVKKYALIGGASPIYEDTERLARELSQPVLPFYRYLPATHSTFLEKLASFQEGAKITVLPLFPQYSVTTTGSAKVWFQRHVPPSICNKLKWIDSYATYLAFIHAWVERICSFLRERGIPEEEATLLFSAHSVPQKVVDQGDPYQKECEASFNAVARAFPKAHACLAYQSKVGFGRWLQPATKAACSQEKLRPHVVFIPISFTSDHFETLYEIEHNYFPLLNARGLTPHRCPTPSLASALTQLIS